jgi:hypothetical protein
VLLVSVNNPSTNGHTRSWKTLSWIDLIQDLGHRSRRSTFNCFWKIKMILFWSILFLTQWVKSLILTISTNFYYFFYFFSIQSSIDLPDQFKFYNYYLGSWFNLWISSSAEFRLMTQVFAILIYDEYTWVIFFLIYMGVRVSLRALRLISRLTEHPASPRSR